MDAQALGELLLSREHEDSLQGLLRPESALSQISSHLRTLGPADVRKEQRTVVSLLMRFMSSPGVFVWALRDRVALLVGELFQRSQDANGCQKFLAALLSLAGDTRGVSCASRATALLCVGSLWKCMGARLGKLMVEHHKEILRHLKGEGNMQYAAAVALCGVIEGSVEEIDAQVNDTLKAIGRLLLSPLEHTREVGAQCLAAMGRSSTKCKTTRVNKIIDLVAPFLDDPSPAARQSLCEALGSLLACAVRFNSHHKDKLPAQRGFFSKTKTSYSLQDILTYWTYYFHRGTSRQRNAIAQTVIETCRSLPSSEQYLSDPKRLEELLETVLTWLSFIRSSTHPKVVQDARLAVSRVLVEAFNYCTESLDEMYLEVLLGCIAPRVEKKEDIGMSCLLEALRQRLLTAGESCVRTFDKVISTLLKQAESHILTGACIQVICGISPSFGNTLLNSLNNSLDMAVGELHSLTKRNFRASQGTLQFVENRSMYASVCVSALCSSFDTCVFPNLFNSFECAFSLWSQAPHDLMEVEDCKQSSIWKLMTGCVQAPESLLESMLPRMVEMWQSVLVNAQPTKATLRKEAALFQHIQIRIWALQSLCQFLRHPDLEALLALPIPRYSAQQRRVLDEVVPLQDTIKLLMAEAVKYATSLSVKYAGLQDRIMRAILALRWRLLQCYDRVPLSLVTSDVETRRCWTKACVEHLEASAGFLSSLHHALVPVYQEPDDSILLDAVFAPVMTSTLDVLEVHKLDGRNNMESLIRKFKSPYIQLADLSIQFLSRTFPSLGASVQANLLSYLCKDLQELSTKPAVSAYLSAINHLTLLWKLFQGFSVRHAKSSYSAWPFEQVERILFSLAADSHVEIRQLVAACLGGLARVYVHVSPQERLEPLMNAIICQAEGENRASHATMCNAVHLLLPQIDAVAARELLPLFISSFGSKLRSFDVESHLAAAKALCNLADTTGIAFCEHILALVKVMVSLAAGMVTPSMAAADANLSITEIRSGLHPDSRQALAELGTTMLRHMLTDWAEYFAEERVPHEAYSQLVNTLLVLLDSHVLCPFTVRQELELALGHSCKPHKVLTLKRSWSRQLPDLVQVLDLLRTSRSFSKRIPLLEFPSVTSLMCRANFHSLAFPSHRSERNRFLQVLSVLSTAVIREPSEETMQEFFSFALSVLDTYGNSDFARPVADFLITFMRSHVRHLMQANTVQSHGIIITTLSALLQVVMSLQRLAVDADLSSSMSGFSPSGGGPRDMEGFSRVSQPSSSAAERRSLDELSDPGSPSDAGSRMEGLLTAPTHSDEEGDEDEQNPAGRPEEGDFAASSAGSSVARGAAAPRLSRGALVPAVLGHRSSTRSIAVRCLCALLETARETSVEVQGRKPPHFEPTVIRKMYTLQPQLTVSLEQYERRYIAGYLQDIVDVGIGLQGHSNLLRSSATLLLKEVILSFAGAEDPDLPGHSLLELFGAQILATIKSNLSFQDEHVPESPAMEGSMTGVLDTGSLLSPDTLHAFTSTLCALVATSMYLLDESGASRIVSLLLEHFQFTQAYMLTYGEESSLRVRTDILSSLGHLYTASHRSRGHNSAGVQALQSADLSVVVVYDWLHLILDYAFLKSKRLCFSGGASLTSPSHSMQHSPQGLQLVSKMLGFRALPLLEEHLHISIESILRLSGDFKIWRRIFENESSMNWTLVVSTLLFTVNLSLSRQSSGEGWLSYREKLCIRALCVCPYTWMQQPVRDSVSLGTLLLSLLVHLSASDPVFSAVCLKDLSTQLHTQAVDGFQPLEPVVVSLLQELRLHLCPDALLVTGTEDMDSVTAPPTILASVFHADAEILDCVEALSNHQLSSELSVAVSKLREDISRTHVQFLARACQSLPEKELDSALMRCVVPVNADNQNSLHLSVTVVGKVCRHTSRLALECVSALLGLALHQSPSQALVIWRLVFIILVQVPEESVNVHSAVINATNALLHERPRPDFHSKFLQIMLWAVDTVWKDTSSYLRRRYSAEWCVAISGLFPTEVATDLSPIWLDSVAGESMISLLQTLLTILHDDAHDHHIAAHTIPILVGPLRRLARMASSETEKSTPVVDICCALLTSLMEGHVPEFKSAITSMEEQERMDLLQLLTEYQDSSARRAARVGSTGKHQRLSINMARYRKPASASSLDQPPPAD